MKYRVVIEPDEDGVFVAQCPELPGCISQGKSRDEALENIRDAIRGYLQSLEKHNEPIPAITEEVVEVGVQSADDRYQAGYQNIPEDCVDIEAMLPHLPLATERWQ